MRCCIIPIFVNLEFVTARKFRMEYGADLFRNNDLPEVICWAGIDSSKNPQIKVYPFLDENIDETNIYIFHQKKVNDLDLTTYTTTIFPEVLDRLIIKFARSWMAAHLNLWQIYAALRSEGKEMLKSAIVRDGSKGVADKSVKPKTPHGGWGINGAKMV